MRKSFLFLLSLIAFSAINAQDDKANTVKFNFFGLGMRTLSFQYERTLNENSSVLLHFGYTLPRSLPGSFFTIDTIAKNGSYNQVQSAKFKGGMQITPEYRYYFKGEGNDGFYLGAYLRYSRYGLEATSLHRDDNTSPLKYYDFKGSWTSTNVGIIMGNQWHLGESFTIDWWILGLQYGANKISMSASGDFSTTDKNQYIEDAKANFQDFRLVKGFSAGMTNTEASLKFGFPSPGFRSGLCLGFRF